MIFANKYYTTYLQKSFVILDNLQKNTDVKDRLSVYGYNQDRFDEGNQLRATANGLFHQHLERRQEGRALRFRPAFYKRRTASAADKGIGIG